MSDFDKRINASDLIDWIMCAFPDWCVGDVREIVDHVNEMPSAQAESTRTFVELVVRYPDPELCTYKEYKGKPYYSIKFIENGETYVGYGTYNPEVLSQFLKEYFISSTQHEKMDRYGYIGIETLLNFCENSKDHSVTPNDFMRMKRVRMPERKKGKWIEKPHVHGVAYCSLCDYELHTNDTNYCPNCGARMEEGEQDG